MPIRFRRPTSLAFAALMQVSIFSSLLHPCCLGHDVPAPGASHQEVVTGLVSADQAAPHEPAHDAGHDMAGSTHGDSHHGSDGACCGGLCQCPQSDTSSEPDTPSRSMAWAFPELGDVLDDLPPAWSPAETPAHLHPYPTGPPARA